MLVQAYGGYIGTYKDVQVYMSVFELRGSKLDVQSLVRTFAANSTLHASAAPGQNLGILIRSPNRNNETPIMFL